MNSIVFHAKKKHEDLVPAFTVRFGTVDSNETMYCTISKPHPNVESYSRKTGNALTEARLAHLEATLDKGSYLPILVKNKKELSKYLPNGTASVLHFYADRAKRYFRLENPKLIVRGQNIIWTQTVSGSRADKQTVLVETTLTDIFPTREEL